MRLAALDLGSNSFHLLVADGTVELCAELSAQSPGELRARGVDAARAQTLAAGAAVIAGLLGGLALAELRISPRGLREGVVLRELGEHRTVAA